MSKLSIHTQMEDLQAIQALMLKHDWAQVRFMHHNRKLPPYVVSFGQADEIESLKKDNEFLRMELAAHQKLSDSPRDEWIDVTTADSAGYEVAYNPHSKDYRHRHVSSSSDEAEWMRGRPFEKTPKVDKSA